MSRCSEDADGADDDDERWSTHQEAASGDDDGQAEGASKRRVDAQKQTLEPSLVR